MASSKPSASAAAPVRTFSEMIRSKKFTVRELNTHLRMATASIKKSEEDPSRMSLGDVFRLADLLDEPIEKVMAELLQQIEQLPIEIHPLTEPPKGNRGRKPKVKPTE
jgi:transposase